MSIIRKLLHYLNSMISSGYIYWDGTEFSSTTSFDQTITMLCGDGSDGNIVFDGTNTFSFASLDTSGAHPIYTLTDHVTATNITISDNITIKPDSYMLRAIENITLGNNITISADGVTGSRSGNTSVAGTALTANYYGGSGAGAAGRDLTTAAGNGIAGGTLSGISVGGAGGVGGNTTGHTGGSGGSRTVWNHTNGDILIQSFLGWFINGTAIAKISGGSGGGSGAKGSGTSGTCVSGAGGSGGGVIIIIAGSTITFGTGCSITAIGGNGADGYWNSTGTMNVSGGGGGGGGFVLIRSLKRSTTGPSFNVSGGTGGIKYSSGGTNGSAGSSGSYYEFYETLV